MQQPNNLPYLLLGGALSVPLSLWMASCAPAGGLSVSAGLLGLSVGPFAGLVIGETKWEKYKQKQPRLYASRFNEIKPALKPEQSMNLKVGAYWLAYSQFSAALGPLGLLTLLAGNPDEHYGPYMALSQTEKKIFFQQQVANATKLVDGHLQHSTVVWPNGKSQQKITITWDDSEDSQDSRPDDV